MIIARSFDAIVGVVCLIAVASRYRGSSIRIVAGDLILWTYTLFLIVPLFFDASGFVKVYEIYPELGVIARSQPAQLVTALVVLIGTILLVRATRRVSQHVIQVSADPPVHKVARWAWLGLAFSPVLVVLASPDPSVYLHFAAVISQRGAGQPFQLTPGVVSDVSHFHVYVTWSTKLSVLGLAVWLLYRKRNAALLVAVPVGLLDFWIGGKRNVVALLIILVIYILSQNRTIDRQEFRRGVAITVLLFGMLIGFSQWFESYYRPYIADSHGAEAFKIDFGRTDVLRLAIAGQLGDAPRPLSEPAESASLYLHSVTAHILTTPKPISYQERVTSIAMGQPISPHGGSITISVMSEAIDNFGWLGVLIGPLILTFLVREGSKVRDPVLGILIALAGSLLIVTEILAIVPVILLLVARMLWNLRRRSPRRTRKDLASTQSPDKVMSKVAHPHATRIRL